MPHMLAQEHMNYVDAMRYGTARNQATIQAALTAIGPAQATLVLTFAGDGVWSITSNQIIPANVSLFLPRGVTVNIASGATFSVGGIVIAFQNGWPTGAGTYIQSTVPENFVISNFQCTQYLQQNTGGGFPFEINGGATDPGGVRLFLNQSGNSGIQISRAQGNPNSTWQLITDLRSEERRVGKEC